MDKNYTVVETSKLVATHGGGHNYDLIADVDIENGHIGFVGELAESVDGQQTYEFGTFSAETIGKKKAILVANPEWDYDEGKRINQALYNYVNKAAIPFRGYDLIAGDVYAVSEGAFDASGVDEIKKNQYLVLAEGQTTLKIVATEAETEGVGFVARIEGQAKRNWGWNAKSGKTYGRPSIVYFVHILRNDIVDTATAASVNE